MVQPQIPAKNDKIAFIYYRTVSAIDLVKDIHKRIEFLLWEGNIRCTESEYCLCLLVEGNCVLVRLKSVYTYRQTL